MEYFTLGKTLFLGIALIISAVVTYKILKYLKIKVDKKFLYGVIPWLIFAVFVRVYEDAGIYPDTFWTTSPGIEILFVAMTIPIFFLAKYIEKKKNFQYWKTLAITGTIPILFHLPFIKIVNPKGVGLIFIFSAIAIGIIGIFRKLIRFDFLSMLAISSHMFDAATTFVSIAFYNYYEQHIVPTFFINLVGGAWVMFLLKAIVIIPVVYFVNKYSEEKDLRNLLLIIIILLGLATALRNSFRLFMGV